MSLLPADKKIKQTKVGDRNKAITVMSGVFKTSRQPILITGPAACGKSTLTKQYAYHLAKTYRFDDEHSLVPLLVTVIDLARTIVENPALDAEADILGAHIEATCNSAAVTAFLTEMRDQRRLVLVLDGIDEAGSVRPILEPYISGKLAREVFLCLTGRENGIQAMSMFGDFVHFKIEALDHKQQQYICAARLATTEVRGQTVSERVKAFMLQIKRNFQELATTPLLLNLMLSEYMQHEQVSNAIQFDGRIVDGQTEFIASFPGVHFVEWGRVTQVMKNKSVACVFVPGCSFMYGDHDLDPTETDRKLCYCQSFLYHDTPDDVKRQQGYLMHESELQLGDAAPKVGAAPFAPRSVRHALLTPQVNPGSLYRCGKST